MLRTLITAVLVVLGAVVFAVSRGPAAAGEGLLGLSRLGTGVTLGAIAGVCIALLSHSLVRLALQADTVAAFRALAIGFGAKFVAAILPWAVLTYLPQAQPIADPVAYLLTYATCVLLVLGVGVLENLRLSNEIAIDTKLGASGASEEPDSEIDGRVESRDRSFELSPSTASCVASVGHLPDSRGLGPLESAS